MITEHPLEVSIARSRSHLSHDVSSFDSGTMFLVKTLFYPVTVVAFLALCRWFFGLVARWITVGLSIALILYLSGLTITPADNVLLIWFALTPFVLLWSGTRAVRRLFLEVGVNHIQELRAVIIGANELGFLLKQRIQQQPLLRINLLRFFEDRESENAALRSDFLLGHVGDVMCLSLCAFAGSMWFT